MTRRSVNLVLPAPNLEPPPLSLSVREEEFRAWVGQAEPGQCVEYHRGHLVIDRARGFSRLDEKSRRELCAIADRTTSLADEGRLILIQRRLD